MMKRCYLLQVRLTAEEHTALEQLVMRVGATRSRLTRKLLREVLNQEIDLLTDEESLLKIAIRQLVGIANNLNQMTMAMHAGLIQPVSNENILWELKTSVMVVKTELIKVIRKTNHRWVKDHAL